MKIDSTLPAGLILAISTRSEQDMLVRIRMLSSELKNTGVSNSRMINSSDFDACRLAVFADNTSQAIEKLELFQQDYQKPSATRLLESQGIYWQEQPDASGKIAFMFPGFGVEHASMLQGLPTAFPITQKRLAFLELLLWNQRFEGLPVEERINKIEGHLLTLQFGLSEGGPAGSIVSLMVSDILKELGISCDMIVGHSNGENTALVASGAMRTTSPELIINVYKIFSDYDDRDTTKSGAFVAVNNLSWKKLTEVLSDFEGDAYPGMQNCTNQQVVFILDSARAQILQKLREERAICIPLPTEFPFHTPLCRDWSVSQRDKLELLQFGKAEIPMYSCTDQQIFPDDDAGIKETLARQWVEPVRFQDCMETLYRDGARVFIDCGPGTVLAGYSKDIFRKRKECKTLAANQDRKNNVRSIATLAAQLWVRGYPVRMDYFCEREATEIQKEQKPKMVKQLTSRQPFLKNQSANSAVRKDIFLRHQELMKDFLASQETAYRHLANSQQDHSARPQVMTKSFDQERWPFLDQPLTTGANEVYFRKRIGLDEFPFLKDHSIGKCLPVVPFTLSLDLVAGAAAYLQQDRMPVLEIREMRSFAWLALDRGQIDLGIQVNRLASNGNHDQLHVRIHEIHPDTQEQHLAFEATVVLGQTYPIGQSVLEPVQADKIPNRSVDEFFKTRLFHGQQFHSAKKILRFGQNGLIGEMNRPDARQFFALSPEAKMRVPGVFLDSMGQMIAYWFAEKDDNGPAIFPYMASRYEQFAPVPVPGEALQCQANIKPKFTGISGSFEIYNRDQQLIARFTDFQLRYFDSPVVKQISSGKFEDISLEDITQNLLEEDGGIWGRTLAKRFLDKDEHTQWLNLQNLAKQSQELLVFLAQRLENLATTVVTK